MLTAVTYSGRGVTMPEIPDKKTKSRLAAQRDQAIRKNHYQQQSERQFPQYSLSENRLKTVVPLRNYPMPKNINTDECLEGALEINSYEKKFHLLLLLQEHQEKRDIEKYNKRQKYVPLLRDERSRNRFFLQLPHNFEIPRSVLPRNKVQVYPLNQPGSFEKRPLTTSVNHVDREQQLIYLDFCEKFLKFPKNMKFRVEFNVNRLIMLIKHRAVDLASDILERVLFPSASTSSYQKPRLLPLSLFNPQLENNPEQYEAVQHIVAGSSKPAPYLVFGPPGTGKTVTLVEAIMQVWDKKSCNILACAPSNIAADLLCKKILESASHTSSKDHSKVFRFYSYSHSVRDIPKELEDNCNLENGKMVIPSKEELMGYQIVVTTLTNASRLVTGGFRRGHYSHIFVDEAGQASEPECIIPLAGLLDQKTGQVVLAGDPKQLGPIITSPIAQKYGLGVSLMERLMDEKLYSMKENENVNTRFITKLQKNYRSHPDILKIPNQLFYKDLQACADEKTRNSYCKWKHLPKTDFPLIFHEVAGGEEQDTGPSIFNMKEVNMLMKYLKKIVKDLQKDMAKIEPNEIGIITPYRKQVEKIHEALQTDKDLKMVNLENVVVGTVEHFQGQEFKAILVSTVRSSTRMTKRSQRSTLGFVKNDKRFNVAITRAKALLIVVGDPEVLRADSTWNELIQFCETNGGYIKAGAVEE